MQSDFEFNLPYRQQALTRVITVPPQFHHRQNYEAIRRPTRTSHGCHLFCMECAKRALLGTAAFKLYLLIAWCIGLAGLMYLQKPETDWASDKKAVITVICLIYLLSQISGLLAVVTQVEKLFIPYAAVLIITIVANTILLSVSIVTNLAQFAANGPHNDIQRMARDFPDWVPMLSLCFFVYNGLCLTSVIHLCAHFDMKRLIAERQRREEMAQRARIYSRLVELNDRDRPVSINVDSPPRYSSLISKPESVCTPPPGYSQLKSFDESKEFESHEEETRNTSTRRALFQENSIEEKN